MTPLHFTVHFTCTIFFNNNLLITKFAAEFELKLKYELNSLNTESRKNNT